MVNNLFFHKIHVFSVGSDGMKKLKKETKNPKIVDYQLPTTWECKPHAVIRLNFSMVDVNDIEASVKEQIIDSLYPAKKTEDKQLILKFSAHIPASRFLNMVCHDPNFPTRVLLVDEYDAPLNRNIFNESAFNRLAESFYQPFFNVVKDNTETGQLTQSVVTGILKFSHVGIFSGYFSTFFKWFKYFLKINTGANQFKDVSLEPPFSTLIGFTKEELLENYMDVIKIYCEEDFIETELNNMELHYNGYKFNVSETENRVFSPVSVIRHLTSSLRVFQDIKQKKTAKNESILLFS